MGVNHGPSEYTHARSTPAQDTLNAGAERMRSPSDMAAYILHLQRTVGNQAVGRWLRQQHLQSPAPLTQSGSLPPVNAMPMAGIPIQRLIITRAEMSDLSQDIDTSNLGLAKAEVDTLAVGNKKETLRLLNGLLKSKSGANEKALVTYIEGKLEKWSKSEDSESAGMFENIPIKWSLRNAPVVDAGVRAGLNIWVAGDPTRGLNWNMLGKHLRGRLSQQEYVEIGNLVALNNAIDTNDPVVLTGLARRDLDACCADIRGALDHLDNFVGKSYRITKVQSNAVFQSKIKEGDLIKDTTFWSTSAIRGSEGAGAGWGVDGTANEPKAYFIIEGLSGKYIAKYSKVEGEQEVLFKDHVVFQVDRIVDQAKANTFFVYITELAAAPNGVPIKSYYTGDAYP